MKTSAITRRARKAMQHLGHTLTLNGESVACIPAAMRDSALRNRDQAFRDTYDTSVVIVTADDSISPRDTVTYAGATRRVLDTAATGDGLQTVLHLGKQFGSP